MSTMYREAFKEALTKLATGDTKAIEFPSASSKGAVENSKGLDELFAHKEGIMTQAKKELGDHFDTKGKKYALRKQTLVEKVAHVVKL